MGIFSRSDEERAIRDDERKRMKEERIRVDERSTRNLIAGLKITVFAVLLIAIAAVGAWLYLGSPKTSRQLVDSLEQVGFTLPIFGQKKP